MLSDNNLFINAVLIQWETDTNKHICYRNTVKYKFNIREGLKNKSYFQCMFITLQGSNFPFRPS